jgi:hypothetical protein
MSCVLQKGHALDRAPGELHAQQRVLMRNANHNLLEVEENSSRV